jgi:hypothetical protein
VAELSAAASTISNSMPSERAAAAHLRRPRKFPPCVGAKIHGTSSDRADGNAGRLDDSADVTPESAKSVRSSVATMSGSADRFPL